MREILPKSAVQIWKSSSNLLNARLFSHSGFEEFSFYGLHDINAFLCDLESCHQYPDALSHALSTH